MPKALTCYGLLRLDTHKVWLRFVDGRPVSHVTTALLAWLCQRLAAEQKRVLILLWDNALWHVSREVRTWIRAHNQQADPSVALALPVMLPNPRPHFTAHMPGGVVPDETRTRFRTRFRSRVRRAQTHAGKAVVTRLTGRPSTKRSRTSRVSVRSSP
jgi:hypothetical protein